MIFVESWQVLCKFRDIPAFSIPLINLHINRVHYENKLVNTPKLKNVNALSGMSFNHLAFWLALRIAQF